VNTKSSLLVGLLVASVGTVFGADLNLTSGALKPGGTIGNAQVFNGMGCTGENVSPDLAWSGAPSGTKAFAVTAYDPDAPTGSGWWHWTVINIPATVTNLAAGASGKSLPAGAVETRTDYGKPGYGGPCPPPGDKPHRYIFKVYALKDTIPLDKEASGAMVGYYANQSKLAEGKLEAKYGRAK
jgi:Raf kinase inhibitor-like YbhB/YbcL family protein